MATEDYPENNFLHGISFIGIDSYYWLDGSWRNHLMVRVAKGVDKREAKQKVMLEERQR